MLKRVLYLLLLLTTFNVVAQTSLKIDVADSVSEIQSTMYGIFFEDINFAADGGLYAELVKNRSFEFTLPKMGWSEPTYNRHSLNSSSGSSAIVRYSGNPSNKRYLHIEINDDSNYELINEGFRGMGIKEGSSYDFSFLASEVQGVSQLKLELFDEDQIIATANVDLTQGNWKQYDLSFTAQATAEKAKLRLKFVGEGSLNIDMISLFPQDTWKGRKGGLRKDIVEYLEAMNPGFIRFPGGCIVEGRTLERRYQWKKTVGPIADRELIVNRWNTEYDRRLTPDYYQSFGIGFFEYFQLSEDLGAEPLPILGCGMACQFNTAELVPMDELDPYIQDALDLIEFANGSIDTYWGKLRSDMGHPEPFNMKYIGIGNEQWGPEYIKRYKVFDKAIKEKYPEIIIVSGSGPFPDGEYFEYGWEQMKKMDVELVDEHYYRSPEWFRTNANRYDSYDRKGPKVFAGEYAAHAKDYNNTNNWECALSEAAFMTGIERNADVVKMSSYAPLLAHTDAWQWKTDLIWFDNLSVYPTPSYYVQQLYGTHAGTHALSVTLNGEHVVGQNGLYASAVKDVSSNELIVKLVNTSENDQEVSLEILKAKIKAGVHRIDLSHDDLTATNSKEDPKNIQPKEYKQKIDISKDAVVIKAQSFSVLTFQIK